VIKRLDFSALRFPQSFKDSRRIGYGTRHYLAHEPVRLVGRQRVATIGDELIETEHVGITKSSACQRVSIFASLMIGPHFSIIEAAAQ
jgi:hypothetical protein